MTNMKAYLQSKGIFETVIAAPFKWQPSGDYMKYPLFTLDGEPFITENTAQCFRFSLWNKDKIRLAQANGQRAPQRFFYEPSTPGGADPRFYHPSMYTPPGLWQAVKDRGGRLGITSGESDMFSLIANGIKNVSTLFGENNIPADLPQWLIEREVMTINYYPDNDRAGAIAAINMWFTFLKLPVGRAFNLFKIPDVVFGAEIKDINDCWRAVKFNTAEFESDVLLKTKRVHPSVMLEGLLTGIASDDHKARNDFQNQLRNWRTKGVIDAMRLDRGFDEVLNKIVAAGFQLADAPPPERGDHQQQHFDEVTPPGLWKQIEFVLGSMGLGVIDGYKHNGWSKNIRCPFDQHEHDDTNPAFALHEATGSYKCQKCGRTGGWKVLAEHLGINVSDFTRPTGSDQGLTPAYPNSAKSNNTTVQTVPNGNVPPAPAQAKKFTIIKGGDLASTSIEKAKAYAADPRLIRGIPMFGGGSFDQLTRGLARKDLFVIVGRTGAGKSTLGLQGALAVALEGKVGIMSPENDPDNLYDRALCHLYGVNWSEVYAGIYEDMPGLEQMYNAIAADRKIEVLDEGMPTIEGLITYVNDSLASAEPIIALFVDSIQNILSAKARDMYSRYENVMMGLQDISRKIPVIATSQANRGPADRRDKWPRLADCFGGSTIEFTLKRGVGVWRPYYDCESGELDEDQVQKICRPLVEAGIVQQITPDTTFFRILKDRFFPTLGQIRPFDFIRTGGYGFRELGDLALPMVIPPRQPAAPAPARLPETVAPARYGTPPDIHQYNPETYEGDPGDEDLNSIVF